MTTQGRQSTAVKNRDDFCLSLSVVVKIEKRGTFDHRVFSHMPIPRESMLSSSVLPRLLVVVVLLLVRCTDYVSAAFSSSAFNTASPSIGRAAIIRRSTTTTTTTTTSLASSWVDDINDLTGGNKKKVENDPRYQPKYEIKTISTEEEFLSFVDGKRFGGLRIIQVHAPWCKACQKSKREVQRLANELSVSPEKDIQFGSIKYTTTEEDMKNLCHSLGVTKLPAVMICCQSYMIDGPFICQYNQVQTILKTKIQQYSSKSFDELMFDAKMNAGSNELLLELQEHISVKGGTSGSDITSILATPVVVVEEEELEVEHATSSAVTTPTQTTWAQYQQHQQEKQHASKRLFSWPFRRRS